MLMYLVKVPDPNAADFRQEFGEAEPLGSGAWMRCCVDREAGPPSDAMLTGDNTIAVSKSENFGDVVFLYGDNSVDSFVYEHARNGELLRKLVWFPMLDDDWTTGWICVEGEPEPWEATLFGKDRIEPFLERERERFDDEGRADAFETYAAQVRVDWESGRIAAGQRYPECDATVIYLVEQHYGREQLP